MQILYIGSTNPYSTAYHRSQALVRIGHLVEVVDPEKAFAGSIQHPILSRVHYRTGYWLLQSGICKWIKEVTTKSIKPDLIWINGGELLGYDALRLLKEVGCPVVLYNNDDPTGTRDGRRFDSLRKAIPLYDLCVVMRPCNVDEFRAYGANRVLRVYMSYDEAVHQPFASQADIPVKFRSEVAFIGTWMRHEKRDEFLLNLVEGGVPIKIWGDRWPKSPHWRTLQPYYQGPGLGGRDYVAAIQGAKVCLGLLSKGNRDLHTQRSLETPFAGGLFCGERTTEHRALYAEGEEAMFWSDAAECAKICKELLADDQHQEQIRQAGMQRVRSLHMGNEDVCRQIINQVFTDLSPIV